MLAQYVRMVEAGLLMANRILESTLGLRIKLLSASFIKTYHERYHRILARRTNLAKSFFFLDTV